eukprot:980523-Amphidinium_carterae.1
MFKTDPELDTAHPASYLFTYLSMWPGLFERKANEMNQPRFVRFMAVAILREPSKLLRPQSSTALSKLRKGWLTRSGQQVDQHSQHQFNTIDDGRVCCSKYLFLCL